MRITADPITPEEAPSGTFCGTVLVERESGAEHLVAVAISLDNRSGVVILVKVTWALLLGALVGVLIRMLSDPVATLLPLRRRINAAERIIAAQDDPSLRGAKTFVENARSALGELDATETAMWVEKLEASLKQAAGAHVGRAARRENARKLAAAVQPARVGKLDAPARRVAVVETLLDSYWPVGIVLILFIVVIGGLQNLYFSNPAFGGDAGDYLQLIAFGAAGQITLATVAEAAGRLSPAK